MLTDEPGHRGYTKIPIELEYLLAPNLIELSTEVIAIRRVDQLS
jgi:hypothetical protein